MIAVVAFALLLSLPQDKTVEGRIRELETHLTSLEKRAAAAREENVQLAKKIAVAERARERDARTWAVSWVKQYATPAGLSAERCAELIELWVEWFQADTAQRPSLETWRVRESELKKRLTVEETAKLAGEVRRGQETVVHESVEKFVKQAQIDSKRGAAFEEQVKDRIPIQDDILLPAAHPKERVDWRAVYGAVRRSLLELDGVLSDEERARLETLVEKWKPKPVRLQIRPSRKK